MPTITRATEKEKELKKEVQNSLENTDRPEGIHVSDLIDPLKAYYRKTDPQPMTEDEIGYFFSGKNFEQMVNLETDGFFGENSVHGSWHDISYEIDFMSEGNIPIELKSSRQKMQYPNKAIGRIKPQLIDDLSDSELVEEFDSYLSQLKKYMVIKNSTTGMLCIFFLNLVVDKKNLWKGSAPPRFRIYKVECTTQELMFEEKNMLVMRDRLNEAIAFADPKDLPKCESWKCKNCVYANNPCETALITNITREFDSHVSRLKDNPDYFLL